jgi:PilZ domain
MADTSPISEFVDVDVLGPEFEPDTELIIEHLHTNKRTSPRYRRNDIRAVLKIHSFLYPRLQPVVVQNISSRGAAIVSGKPLKANSKVCLYLLFACGKRFNIEARVVHTEAKPRYGLKFTDNNNDLGEFLLHTQTNLDFG